MVMRININQLYAFYMVARYGGVSAAADKLCVSAPAVSMQIKKLEEWLGFKLFNRRLSSLELNSHGQQMYPLAEAVFDRVRLLEDSVEELMGTQGKELVLGTYHIPAQYFIPDMLRHVLQEYPYLRTRILLGTQDESIERLLKNDIHVAFIIGDPQIPEIQTVPLFEQDLLLVTGAESNLVREGIIRVQDLNTLPIALQPSGTGFIVSMCSFFAEHQITPRIVLENLSSDILKKMLLHTSCAGFFVRFAIEEDLREGLLREIRIVEGAPCVQFNFAFLKKNASLRQLQQFLKALSDFFLPGSFCSLP